MKKIVFAALLLSVAAYGADAKVKGKVLEGNRIEITADVPGTYTLVYEGPGRKKLADYENYRSTIFGQQHEDI